MVISVFSSSDIQTACQAIETEAQGLHLLGKALSETNLGPELSRAVDLILPISGRVILTGIGKSGHVAHKIQSTLASTGTPSLFVHPAEASHGDLGMIQSCDVVMALSVSGETSELADIVAYVRRRAIPLISMTARASSTIARASDIALVLPQAPEACPMGLAPTTSSTMLITLGDALAITLLARRKFTANDFGAFHPGGQLGQRLRMVCDLMHTGEKLPLAEKHTPIPQVIVEITKKSFGCSGVIDENGVLCGIITDGDLRRALDFEDIRQLTARDIMNPSPKSVSGDILAIDAIRFMNDPEKPVSSLFIVDTRGCPVGIIHMHDLLRAGIT